MTTNVYQKTLLRLVKNIEWALVHDCSITFDYLEKRLNRGLTAKDTEGMFEAEIDGIWLGNAEALGEQISYGKKNHYVSPAFDNLIETIYFARGLFDENDLDQDIRIS